jgi:hypothetical protein
MTIMKGRRVHVEALAGWPDCQSASQLLVLLAYIHKDTQRVINLIILLDLESSHLLSCESPPSNESFSEMLTPTTCPKGVRQGKIITTTPT